MATEICNMVHDKCVDAVGISEVSNLQEEMRQRRQYIMQHVVSEFNSVARLVTSVDNNAAQAAWKRQTAGHHIFIWNSSRIRLTAYE